MKHVPFMANHDIIPQINNQIDIITNNQKELYLDNLDSNITH